MNFSLRLKHFVANPNTLYTTQDLDRFATNKEGFNMDTGQRNPPSIIN